MMYLGKEGRSRTKMKREEEKEEEVEEEEGDAISEKSSSHGSANH